MLAEFLPRVVVVGMVNCVIFLVCNTFFSWLFHRQCQLYRKEIKIALLHFCALSIFIVAMIYFAVRFKFEVEEILQPLTTVFFLSPVVASIINSYSD